MVEQREEFATVFVREEHQLSIISTLGDVERVVGRSEAEFAGHLTKLVDFASHSSHLNEGGGREGVPFRIDALSP